MELFKKVYIKYGLIMCGVVILCLLYMEVTGQNNSYIKPPLVTTTLFFAPVIVWYLGLSAKKKLLNGQMTFIQGFGEGIKIALVYALISPLIFGLYYQLVNPGMIQALRKSSLVTMASDTTIIFVDMILSFITTLFMGIILSAITALFLKSSKK